MAMGDRDKTNLLRTVFDVMFSMIFVVDDDVRIHEYNAAAATLLSDEKATILKHRGGEVLNCLHSTEVSGGCGHAPSCKSCVIRNSVAEASQGTRIVRRRTRIEIFRNGEKLEIYALITASPFRFKERPHVLLVIEDISEIAELQRMIPICSVCKEIRDEKKTWFRMETYFKENWDVDFSHGLCPKCFEAEMEKLKSFEKLLSGTSSDS